MEAYSRAGFPYGAAEIFSLMQHMGFEPCSAFWTFLLQRSLNRQWLEKTNYIVFGLGDSGYHKYNFVAKKLDKRLADLGGTIILERGLGDDQHSSGYEGSLDPWMSSLWTMLYNKNPKFFPKGLNIFVSDMKIIGQPKVEITYLDSNAVHSQPSTQIDLKLLEKDIVRCRTMLSAKKSNDKSKPDYFLKLVKNQPITRASYDKDVRHLEFEPLLSTDDNLSQCLVEASLFQFPSTLRRLFATMLIFCEPGNVRKLWDDYYDSLSEDYRKQYGCVERVQNMVLIDIRVFLESMSKKLSDYDLPNVSSHIDLQSRGYREVQEEYSINVEYEDLHAPDSLNLDQKFAYDEIMRHVDENIPGVFFIDGPGGTGNTFLYKALLANIRVRGLIALATTTSGVAANNMPRGRTAHSRFGIPPNLDNNSMCNITKQSGKAQLLREAKVIIWDEAAMAKRQAVEAVDRTMQDITDEKLSFGGKIMVMGGDFIQVLPVVRRGTRAQIVDSSLQMSPLWASVKRLRLNINMRAVNDPWFSDFLLRVGDGKEETLDESFIRIPDNMSISYTDKTNSVDALIDAIFPSLQSNGVGSKFIISRAILSTKTESVDEINNKLIERFYGE
ncbi:unnamed protein product [Lactuca virosa]|uniref:ATP-dependent DNA helicase n=1 Tax=Lactuca virosa TaxID=75947 RepID=A0AAU9NFA0_9ASTR|nr:unnamed protein product [Lactuca virosa]